jgi:hypothetical protein
MRWAVIDDTPVEHNLLYQALMYILQPDPYRPVDYRLHEVLSPHACIGGDPGWEVEHIPGANGQDSYHVWVDPEMSGIEPAEATYDDRTVRHAVAESLKALADKWPERRDDVRRVIRDYRLDDV